MGTGEQMTSYSFVQKIQKKKCEFTTILSQQSEYMLTGLQQIYRENMKDLIRSWLVV